MYIYEGKETQGYFEWFVILLGLLILISRFRIWNKAHWVPYRSAGIGPKTGLAQPGGGYWTKRGKTYDHNPDGSEGLM